VPPTTAAFLSVSVIGLVLGAAGAVGGADVVDVVVVVGAITEVPDPADVLIDEDGT